MYFANKYYLFYIIIVISSLKIYSQDINDLRKADTLYIKFIDSPKAMEKTTIIVKNLFDKSDTEFNSFYVYFPDDKKTDLYYFQLNNTKSIDLIKKISNHALKQIDSKIILNYCLFSKLGYHQTMDLLKDKKIFVIDKTPYLFERAKIYEVKILNNSYLKN